MALGGERIELSQAEVDLLSLSLPQSARRNVAVPPAALLTTISFGLNVSIVLVTVGLTTCTSSALLMFRVIDFPLIAQVPRIVPVTP